MSLSPFPRPNLLIITAHDLGRWLGCYGRDVSTPNLDRFAGQGVLFEQAFCAAPQCSPSRASLFTGLYPPQHGVLGLTHARHAWDMRPEVTHLAEHLGRAGYRAALFGNQHEARTVRSPAGRIDAREAPAAELAAAVADFLAGSGDGGPFYAQVGFFEPHRQASRADEARGTFGFCGDRYAPDLRPAPAPPPYLRDTPASREEMAEFATAVAVMDRGVGEILAALDQSGQAENTIVVFTTDHGMAMPRAKCSLYDSGLEVALAVRWPGGGWAGGERSSRLASHLDVLPTVLRACGIEPPAGLPGRPLFGPAADARKADADLFFQLTYHDFFHPQRAIRGEGCKLIVNFSSSPIILDCSQSWHRRSAASIPFGDQLRGGPAAELYDLARDPWELHDLGADPARQVTRARLLARLRRWMQETDDPLLHGVPVSPAHREVLDLLAESAGGEAG